MAVMTWRDVPGSRQGWGIRHAVLSEIACAAVAVWHGGIRLLEGVLTCERGRL